MLGTEDSDRFLRSLSGGEPPRLPRLLPVVADSTAPRSLVIIARTPEISLVNARSGIKIKSKIKNGKSRPLSVNAYTNKTNSVRVGFIPQPLRTTPLLYQGYLSIMDQIFRDVVRAQRKLQLELFLQRLVRCWSIGLLVAVVAVGLPKLVFIEDLPAGWVGWCLSGTLLLGTLVALLWTLWQGYGKLAAAMEIDARYGLRERVASSLSLDHNTAQTPAGQALLADARRALGKIDISRKFSVHLGRRAWLPLLPAALVFLLATLVDDRQTQSRADSVQSPLTRKQLDEATHTLRKRLAERRKQATQAGLKDAEALLRELEVEAQKLQDKNIHQRKQALVKLNDLASQIARRQQKLGNGRELRKQFAQMKNLGRGPADKLADAMKQGKWGMASRELDKLRKQIADGKMSPQAREQLVKQLRQMQEKLQAAADARQQAASDLKKEIEAQRQQGNLVRAAELQQQLDQLAGEGQQTKRLQQMARQMGQLGQSLAQGDQQGAESSLQQMAQALEQIEQDLAEGYLLDAAQGQFQFAKDTLGGQACSQCQGAGCQACQGGGAGSRMGRGGNGMGPGEGGFGPRPDEKNRVKFRDSRVPQKPGRGSAVIVGEVDGPNRRGQVTEAIQAEMATHGNEPADPLVVEQLPRSHREHAEQYFNLLREGR